MKIRTIVTIIAAALLSVGLVPVSSAQDTNSSAQDGIEIITIIGKRPAPTVATACVNEVIAHTATERKNSDGSFSEEVLESGRTKMISQRKAIKRCIDQAATSFEAQI